MRRSTILGSFLTVALVATGCQDHLTQPPPTAEVPEAFSANSIQSIATDAPRVDRSISHLPSDARISDLVIGGAAGRAINPADHVCPATTPVVDWLIGELIEILSEDPDAFVLLFDPEIGLAADLVPTLDAVFFQTEGPDEFFGYDGEYTQLLLTTERDVKRFWDIPSESIQLVAMHGTMLLDEERVSRVYEEVFEVPQPFADIFAELVASTIASLESVDGGDHPIFTFNAVATGAGFGLPNRIIMGDGVLDGYEALGFGSVAPQAIYAHEFAHQVQFANDYGDDPLATTGTPAEQTRYTELMADAMAAYYLTHKRGGAMNWWRVEQFLKTFFNVGDCAFMSGSHHGTPNQRLRAAKWGYELANEAQRQGHILSSDEVHDLFVANYASFVAPDAGSGAEDPTTGPGESGRPGRGPAR